MEVMVVFKPAPTDVGSLMTLATMLVEGKGIVASDTHAK
jgi:hypothetical protein